MDPRIGRVFKGRLSVLLAKVPGRLRLSEEAASEIVAGWIASELAIVWPDAPGGAELVLSTLARAEIGTWGPEPKPWWDRGNEVPFSDLEVPGSTLAGSFADSIVDPASDFPAQVARAEVEAQDPTQRKVGTFGTYRRDGQARVLPAVGLSRPWGPLEVARHRQGRPRNNSPHAKQPGPCPTCEGVVMPAGGCCLVCERTSETVNRVLEQHRDREDAEAVKPAAKFKPRGRGAKRKAS